MDEYHKHLKCVLQRADLEEIVMRNLNHTKTAAEIFGVPEADVTSAMRMATKQASLIFLYSNPKR